jgi:hypothetical protein
VKLWIADKERTRVLTAMILERYDVMEWLAPESGSSRMLDDIAIRRANAENMSNR